MKNDNILTYGGTSLTPQFKYKTLANHIASALLIGSVLSTPAAFAAEQVQETGEKSKKVAENKKAALEDDEDFEIIQVTGIRHSEISALDRKRNAGTSMDSIVAEDIGEFPDKNVGEALQRISGVQLGRDFGEGANISIRGVEPELVRVEMNGVGAMGTGGGRSVDFRDMASELVKSLDVIKGSEARLTEGGVGGTVQINTRKPNEFEDDFLSVNAEAQYNDLITDVMPKFNFTGVKKFGDDLGVLLNVTGSNKTTMINALRNTEWARFADYDNSPEKTFVNPDYSGFDSKASCASSANEDDCLEQWDDFSPYLPRYGIWDREEKRMSANAIIQYQITDNLSSHVSYTYNERDKKATDLNYQFETQSTARIKEESVLIRDNHNVSYFESDNASVTNRTLGFDWDQKTSVIDAGFVYNNGAFRVEGVVAKSTSDQVIDSRDTHVTANGVAGMKFTLDEAGKPDIDLSDAYFRNPDDLTDTSDKFDINSADSYRARSRFKYAPSQDEAEETMAKLDVTYIPDSDFFTLISSGIQLKKETYVNANWQRNIIRDVGTTYNDDIWTMADQVKLIEGNRKWSPELFDGYNLGVGTIGSYNAIDTQPFIDDIMAISNANTTSDDLDVKTAAYDIEVESRAIYLQANWESELSGMRLWGNFGVRYVETDTAANGDVTIEVYKDQFDENGEILRDEAGNPLSPVNDLTDSRYFKGRETIKDSYTDVLPSFNVNLGITEELTAFFGVSKVMARPKMGDINVNANCRINDYEVAKIDDLPNTCSAGNPALDPYRANQAEVALNWYPDPGSLLAISYFYKDITTFILPREAREDINFFNDGRLWRTTQVLNGEGIKTHGIELQANYQFSTLPEPFNGLGVKSNYTYMDSKDVGIFDQLSGAELPFPSQSKNSYNLTGYYEDDVYSFKVSYNYRSEYLANAADRSGNPSFIDEAGYMDAKFTYQASPNLKLYVDGRNLTKEVKLQNSGSGRLSDLQWSGREFSVGFTYKM